ncbi:hypothetical protein BO85DRAFT_443982 [Aspergillus piperis CBS 112811]|uniref:Uncharacterized protein n=1 Tax=Aspergillus piperis CBS 112811 TaxID=1448313 RepID=A0A8G1RG22_9EURO|nr:hypothetical protein BO85DRAFT_443982 [Aspergillus piperis CBS 112811]RAH62635.1 hypothetical protein BO85DRAFT_443982 [Aspergillus piperis CBS 112811]
MPSPPSQGSRDVAPYPLAASFHTPPSLLRRLRDFLPESDGPYKKTLSSILFSRCHELRHPSHF